MSHTTATINRLNALIDKTLLDKSLSAEVKFKMCDDLITLRNELLDELDEMSNDLQEAANGSI